MGNFARDNFEDYIDLTNQKSATEAKSEELANSIQRIDKLISRYSNIALYAGVVGDLMVERQDVIEEYERTQNKIAELTKTLKGFEGVKRELLETVQAAPEM